MPLELPPYFSSKVFRLMHAQQLTPSGEVGFIQTLNRSSPFWMAEYATPGLSGDRYNEMITFLDQLEGSMETMLAYDPRRPMPYAHRTAAYGSNPWHNVGHPAGPRITAQNYTNSTITLDRFKDGVTITKSDYISVQVGNIWYLFRAQETKVSPAAAAAFTLLVRPRPNIVNLVATVIRYQRACIEMKKIGDYDEEDSVDGLPSLRFRAGQYTNRIPV